MILAIEKDGVDILQGDNIQHVLVEEFIYDAPLIFKIGVNETTMQEDKFIQGEPYRLITMYNHEINVVLADIESFSTLTGGNTGVTDYIFMEEDSYKLKHNLFPPEATVWGVSLKRHIVGSLNQLETALIELRKMGLSLAISKNLKIIQKQVFEYKGEEGHYIKNIVKAKIEKTISKRNNYAMITDGKTDMTTLGAGSGIHIPMMKKEQVQAFNLKIEPKYIIVAKDANLDILLGSAVFFKQEKYSVMEKQTYYSKDKVSAIITLGYS